MNTWCMRLFDRKQCTVGPRFDYRESFYSCNSERKAVSLMNERTIQSMYVRQCVLWRNINEKCSNVTRYGFFFKKKENQTADFIEQGDIFNYFQGISYKRYSNRITKIIKYASKWFTCVKVNTRITDNQDITENGYATKELALYLFWPYFQLG